MKRLRIGSGTAPVPMTRLVTLGGNKADNLAALAGRLRGARIPRGTLIHWRQWRDERSGTMARALAAVAGSSIAVRSCRTGEDSAGAGNAGRYRSVIGVSRAQLGQAIDVVFSSYGRPLARDVVLLQRCISPVSEAIVAANCVPADGAPYDSISFAAGPDSAAITAGTVAAETLYLAHRQALAVDARHAQVRALLREIEQHIGRAAFELELVRSAGVLWLLQLRLLSVNGLCGAQSIARARARAARKFAGIKHCDGPPLLGLMPDWNPAELLGEHPRPLALDLFQRLISRDTWWQARVALGYRRPAARELLSMVGGRPYVNVQSSFASLLPAALDDAAAARAIKAWSQVLRARPQLHDRVETAIALTCAEFDGNRRLHDAGVDRADCARIWSSLKVLTRDVHFDSEVPQDFERVLEKWRNYVKVGH